MSNVFPETAATDLIFAILGLVFAIWPLVLLLPLKYRGNGLGSLLGMWCILAVVRIALIFDRLKMWDMLLLAEPTRTLLFELTGIVLLLVLIAKYALQLAPEFQLSPRSSPKSSQSSRLSKSQQPGIAQGTRQSNDMKTRKSTVSSTHARQGVKKSRL